MVAPRGVRASAAVKAARRKSEILNQSFVIKDEDTHLAGNQTLQMPRRSGFASERGAKVEGDERTSKNAERSMLSREFPQTWAGSSQPARRGVGAPRTRRGHA